MGAIGALVSLMSRTRRAASTAPPDYESGRDTLKWMGSFRPVVGATFGVVLFFGIRSGVLPIDLKPGQQNNTTFALLAFFAGFSERWREVSSEVPERTFRSEASRDVAPPPCNPASVRLPETGSSFFERG